MLWHIPFNASGGWTINWIRLHHRNSEKTYWCLMLIAVVLLAWAQIYETILCILNLCYHVLLPALTCSSEAISKSALIDVKHFQRTVWVIFFGGGSVHDNSRLFHDNSRPFHDNSRSFHGLSMVCPRSCFSHKKRTTKTHTDFCSSPHHHFAGKFQHWRPVKKLSKCNYGELNWVYIASIWYAIALANCWRNVGLFMWMFKAIS